MIVLPFADLIPVLECGPERILQGPIIVKPKRYIKKLKSGSLLQTFPDPNWCPGSQVLPYVMSIGELNKRNHQLEIDIDATPIDGDKLNHWLVSAYLTYEVE